MSLKVPEGKCIYFACGGGVLSGAGEAEVGLLASCAHGEGDARLTVHVLDATSSGHR